VWVVAASIPVLALVAALVTERQVAGDVSCADGATHASCGASGGLAALVVIAVGTLALALTYGASRLWSSPVPAWVMTGLWLAVALVYIALPPSG
jgi:membrane associated rhomboid family serine protease